MCRVAEVCLRGCFAREAKCEQYQEKRIGHFVHQGVPGFLDDGHHGVHVGDDAAPDEAPVLECALGCRNVQQGFVQPMFSMAFKAEAPSCHIVQVTNMRGNFFRIGSKSCERMLITEMPVLILKLPA